jgi:hypothetical protein
MRCDEFTAAVPELAALGDERLRSKELCLIGTLREGARPTARSTSRRAQRRLRAQRKEGDFKLYGPQWTSRMDGGLRRWALADD